MSGHKQLPHKLPLPAVWAALNASCSRNSQQPSTKFHQREPSSLRPFSRHKKLQWGDCRCFFSSDQGGSALAAHCHFPPKQSQPNGVCAGKQHHPPPLPGCHTGSLGSGLLTMETSHFSPSLYPSCSCKLHRTKVPALIHFIAKEESNKGLTDSTGSEEGTEHGHHHCTVLPENILEVFIQRPGLPGIFPWSSRISSDDLHITRQ